MTIVLLPKLTRGLEVIMRKTAIVCAIFLAAVSRPEESYVITAQPRPGEDKYTALYFSSGMIPAG